MSWQQVILIVVFAVKAVVSALKFAGSLNEALAKDHTKPGTISGAVVVTLSVIAFDGLLIWMVCTMGGTQ